MRCFLIVASVGLVASVGFTWFWMRLMNRIDPLTPPKREERP